MLVNPIAPIISSEPWQVEAACAEVGPMPWDTWPGSLTQLNMEAIRICESCPVRVTCLEYALRMERLTPPEARSCIFGGLTPAQRYEIARRRHYHVPDGVDFRVCASCGTAMRLYGTPADDTGLATPGAKGMCNACYKRAMRRARKETAA